MSTNVEVYLSLDFDLPITTNNTEIVITDIGEVPGSMYPSLTCHTDLTTCCRNSDNNFNGSLGGEWYYPDGRMVPKAAAGEGFYRIRNAPQVARLARRLARSGSNDTTYALGPTGTYCCVIPTTGGEMTLCANIGNLYSTLIAVISYSYTCMRAVACQSLPPLTNGTIFYSDPTLGVGSVATYSCNTGYILFGVRRRSCKRSRGRTWSGSAPTCIGECM